MNESPTAVEARLSGRLEFLLHRAERTGDLTALTRLHTATVADTGVSVRLRLLVECRIEELRSRCREVEQSVQVWSGLRARAETVMDAADPALLSIRSFHAQYTRRRGRPEDLDAGVRMYEQEWRLRAGLLGKDHHRTRTSHANLGLAIRDRALPGDLDRALELLEEETRHRLDTYSGTHPFTWEAQTVLAQTYVAAAEAHESGPTRLDHAARGRELAELVVGQRRLRYGWDDPATLRAQLVKAHALLVLGHPEEAAMEIKHVRTVSALVNVPLDPGWAEFLLASALAATSTSTPAGTSASTPAGTSTTSGSATGSVDRDALTLAKRALVLRLRHYPEGGRKVMETRALVERLSEAA